MTTETIQPAPQTAELPPKWRAHLQQAYNATWQAAGRVDTGPFCVTQNQIQAAAGAYSGNLHYLDVAAVKQLADAYDVEVTATSGPSGTHYQATANVEGVPVTAWAVDSSEAGDLA
ncbi:hypothetical protein [Streptomyces sp. NPDC048332]|uniref:hypothetical protein n=1 Tax=Streptomyces sp. NPDC048332 TaxID=3154619 RepID=UPI00342AE185